LNSTRLVWAGALAIILAVVGYGVFGTGLLSGSGGGQKSVGAPASVKLAPDFQLTTFEGEKYALSEDQGKVRVVFFMIAPY